jgi:hypothetical protein
MLDGIELPGRMNIVALGITPAHGTRAPSSLSSASQPTMLRSTGISRSIETTSTPRSTRSTPRGRTRQTTGTAPRRHHRRRRRDSHAAWSRTRTRCQSSYVLVFVSIANPGPVSPIASESMSPRPRHGIECRSRQPSSSRTASARRTSSSERAPTRLRPASASQCRAYRPNPSESTSRTPAAEIAPALATASSTAPALAVPATAAFDSRRYCCRRA